jgi:uncharacterized damage-inducible protein DinB
MLRTAVLTGESRDKNDEGIPEMKTQGTAVSGEVGLLVGLLDEGYDQKAWHGPNLRGAIRRLSAEEACWRPYAGRHSIAEHVVHCAYWKYAVRRRLRGDKRGSFALKGSNWFAIPAPLSEARWKELVSLLDAEHRLLWAEVAEFPAERLHEVPKGGKVPFASILYGIALHDVYHAGQIQLLKRLHGDSAPARD